MNMKSYIRITLLSGLTVLLLSGCNSTGNDPGPGGVTKTEAEALDAAADTLGDKPQIPEGQASKNPEKQP